MRQALLAMTRINKSNILCILVSSCMHSHWMSSAVFKPQEYLRDVPNLFANELDRSSSILRTTVKILNGTYTNSLIP